ncbi:MAG TPA: acyl-CoA thioesterase [Oligoflexia bacterium]|nr:acyl-CoA thioesterase [Oligoflexia bacterium]HMR25216.1 acyl-CoA thioesterase [Oligoflexia bacterium]
MSERLSKAPRESYVEMIQQVLPGDTNPLGTVFGGKVMMWIDTAGAVAAMRHVRGNVVTASIDKVDFHASGHVGDIMVLKSKVTYTGRTSLEVSVEVLAENPRTGKRQLTTDAFLTFVAIDENHRPIEVPELIPETEEEQRNFAQGKARREARKKAEKMQAG